MFKNKHVITALIVAPILAITAYFAVDYIVAERPHAAVPGGQYELLTLPNCRYASGQCTLKNGDLKIIVRGEPANAGGVILYLDSIVALEEVQIAVVDDASNSGVPERMFALSDDLMKWELRLPSKAPATDTLRLVLSAGGVVYYGETHMPFLNYETSYHKDFR